MKKNILLLLISFCLISLIAQEIVLPNHVKEFHYQLRIASDYEDNFKYNSVFLDSIAKAGLLDTAIKAFEQIYQMNFPENTYKGRHRRYADLLALSGNLEKAIQFYDLAFNLKNITAKDFDSHIFKKCFEKDTLLYNKKKNEYYEKSICNYYTAQEFELLIEVNKIFANDQFARHYDNTFPQHRNCTKNIIEYADSITMVRITDLYKKYPEFDDPLSINALAGVIIGRHIFTAYPEFWLICFEPNARRQLLDGNYDPQTYARTYDRCMITSGKAQYSYYGEWDDGGKYVNPDSISVDRRRENLALPLLKNKPKEEFKFFITY
jgi:tetratricopeptide (TPR) repeat protein